MSFAKGEIIMDSTYNATATFLTFENIIEFRIRQDDYCCKFYVACEAKTINIKEDLNYIFLKSLENMISKKKKYDEDYELLLKG